MADALLEQAAEWMGGRGGEYLSPRSVRKLVVAIAEPVGSVYNPASGIGQLMIDAAREGNSGITGLVGQEINSRVWALAQLNLVVHRVDGEIALGDVFGDDHYPELRADRVVCVPPWNQKAPVLEKLMGDRRWLWGEPASNDGNAAWIQHCLYHLADRGRAVIVMPSAALFESGRAGRIRQRIIKAGLLDAVIALPPGLFAWTSLPCSVLVFAKGRRNGAGTHDRSLRRKRRPGIPVCHPGG
jgi:type I restriction enzyme M protein